MFPGRRSAQRNERGTEIVSFLFTFPLIFILLLGVISVGMYFNTRAQVTEIARDAARGMAAYGRDCPVRPVIPDGSDCFSEQAMNRLWKNGKCTLSSCEAPPAVRCMAEDGSTVVTFVGEIVTCEVDYPYEGINKALLDTPIGLGIGGLLDGYEVEVSTVAEVGVGGTIGIQ